jgi:uncharacterized protein (DUF2147 family)
MKVWNMRAFIGAVPIGLTICAYVPSTHAQQSAASAVGLWEQVDASGKPEGWFRIYECDGRYLGQIVKIFPKPGEDPNGLRCTECEGDQKDAPVLGLVFIKGMKRNGLRYQGGTILDPRDGSKYKALMELSPNGERLQVRGYLAIPLFGETQVWRRVEASDKSQMPPPPP